MAPAVSTKKDTVSLSSGHPEHARFIAAMREIKQKMTANADSSATSSPRKRKIHYEEAEARDLR